MYKLYLDATVKSNKRVELLDSKTLESIDCIVGEIDLVSSIKTILEKNKLTLDDIDAVDANTGPGSFTGIKASIAIVNMLRWQCSNVIVKKPLEPLYGSEPNITGN